MRAGSRPRKNGLHESDIPDFVMYGGIGAVVGASTGYALARQMNMGQLTTLGSIAVGTIAGHMIGHEESRKKIEKRNKLKV